MVISGGDLAERVTIEGPVSDAGMFGAQIANRSPQSDVVYRVDFFSMDGHQPAGTLSDFPAHDGRPMLGGRNMASGPVPPAFNEKLQGYIGF